MGDEIEHLKSVLRSLVVSSPTQMDVRSLMRDYRNMIGSPVPLRKNGHTNPVDFLKERFSDCFLFSGPSSNPVLTLIVPNTLKHIDKFVQKQKSAATSRFNPKRRSVPEELVNQSKEKSISKSFNQKNLTSQVEMPTKVHTKSEPNVPPMNRCVTIGQPNVHPTKSYITVSKLNKPSSKPNVAFESNMVLSSPCLRNSMRNRDINVQLHHSDNIVEDTVNTDSESEHLPVDSSDAVKNFFKKRLPLYNSSQYLDEEPYTAKPSKAHVLDDDSGRNTSSSGHSAKTLKFEQLKQDILKLITDAPDGVWCTDLIKLYKDRYNQDLNFSRFGYTSLISLVYCLEQRVQITRPVETGDWLLQERERAVPPQLAPPPRRQPRAPRAPPRAAGLDPEDALPGIDFDPDVFPEDCMQFMDSIDVMSMEDFRPGAMVEVIIGEVYSPSQFWFIRLGENYNMAMDDMMDDMTRYYRNEGQDRVLARGAVQVGHYCSSLYENDWHRSLIVKIVDSDTVKVRHVDYGTVDTVSVRTLKPLRRAWARLPAQACRARLAGVCPPAAGWRWPHAACTAFLALVTGRRLVANVVALDARDRVAEVLLIDTAGALDVSVGAELTRAGHADPRRDSALRTLDVYLYPRFEALESGATPNYAELHAYLRDGIALDYVSAYRDHVPQPPAAACRPAAPASPYRCDSPYERVSPYEHDSPYKYDSPDKRDSPYKNDSSDKRDSPYKNDSSDKRDSPYNHASPYKRDSPYRNESPDNRDSPSVSESPEDEEALERCSPASPPAAASDADERAIASDVAMRIPLFLPSASASSKPETASIVDPEPLSARPQRSVTAGSVTLSADAPAYLPGLPYKAAPPSPAPGPAGPARSPPPPYGGPGAAPGVTLSLAECETYRVLSHVNPEAAHWFMVGAMGRATAVPVRPRCSAPAQVHPPPPPRLHRPLPSQMYHPPPPQMFPRPSARMDLPLPPQMHSPLLSHMHHSPLSQMHSPLPSPSHLPPPSQMHPPPPLQIHLPPPSRMHPLVRIRPPPGFGI